VSLGPRAPPATAAAAGFSHSLVLARDGRVWGWGQNDHGQLGLGDTAPRAAPCAVEWEMPAVAAVACGEWHSLALTADGLLYAWGMGAYGQLGAGAHDSLHLPTPVLRLVPPGPDTPFPLSLSLHAAIHPSTPFFSLSLHAPPTPLLSFALPRPL
jgi:hypothetical protein